MAKALIEAVESNQETSLTVFNTHMDDQSDDQRRLAASLVLYRARYEAVNAGGPVLVMGDFNRQVKPFAV